MDDSKKTLNDTPLEDDYYTSEEFEEARMDDEGAMYADPHYSMNDVNRLEQENKDFYQKLRVRMHSWLETKMGSKNKYADYLLFAPDLFHLMVKLVGDKRVDTKDKAILVGAVTYFVAPFDFIPEFIVGPGGYIDDIIIASYVINTLVNKFSPEMIEEHWAGDQTALSVIQKVSGISGKVLGKTRLQKIVGAFSKSK